jgi:hypothetical protein
MGLNHLFFHPFIPGPIGKIKYFAVQAFSSGMPSHSLEASGKVFEFSQSFNAIQALSNGFLSQVFDQHNRFNFVGAYLEAPATG